jgi:NADH-quinone oxidoreductase subunit A
LLGGGPRHVGVSSRPSPGDRPLSPLSQDFFAAHASVLVFFGAVVAFAFGGLIFWWLISPKRASEEKLTTYECGEEPQGSAWIQFNIRFYVFALIFVVFDVEAAFLLPWAVAFRDLVWRGLGPLVLIDGLVFIAILVVALVYVWRKGDLAWVRPEDRS